MNVPRPFTSILDTALCAAAAVMLCAGSAPALGATFAVAVESGTRAVPSGDEVAYDLFVPVVGPALPTPPWPAVVLTHGFQRDRSYHRANAEYLAAHGVIVLTPDMVSLFGGRAAQQRNIGNTVDHLRWLQRRSRTAGDALHGRLDPERIALAGHSAGGAVSFEAALDAQQAGVEVAALLLIDAVPWNATLGRSAELAALPVASLRSEPSACNANSNVLSLLDDLPVPVEDVLLSGATHCDPENPSDVFCALVCGAATQSNTALYQRLAYLFLQDALRAPSVEDAPTSYFTALSELAAQHAVVRNPYGPPTLLRLRIDGRDAGDGPVRLSRPARIGVDLYLNGPTGDVDWQLGVAAVDRVVWLTPSGPSRDPAALLRTEAAPLYDYTLIPELPVPGAGWTLVLRVADAAGVLAEDRLAFEPAR